MLTEINKVLGKLATTNRYSDTRLINPESVLEHTGYVVTFAMFITIDLNQFGEGLNELMVLEKAVLHDIEESKTGDIIAPTKHSSRALRNLINDYATDCAEDILENLPGYPASLQVWIDAKKGKEGFIVAVADTLSVVYKIEQEILQFGNLHLKNHLEDGLMERLETMKHVVLAEFKYTSTLLNLLEEGREICRKISEYT